MQTKYNPSNRSQYIKVCGILTLIVIILGICLAYLNTGNLVEGLHQYGSAIIVITIGLWLALSSSPKASSIGLVMVSASLIFLLMGIRFL